MKKENRQTKLRVAVSVIGVLLAIIIALGVTLGVATKWGKDLDNLKPGKDEEALSSGFLVTTDLSSEPTGGAMQISLIAKEASSSGNIDETSEADKSTIPNSYVLKATIQSEEIGQDVSWGVEWANNDDWAQRKTASDYVSVAPGDPTTEATVTCLKPFGAQIKVTCTSVSDPLVKAECVCDYIKQIESAKFKGQPLSDNAQTTVSPYTISPGGLCVLSPETFYTETDRVEIVDPVFTAYTIDNTIQSNGFDLSKSYIKFTEEFITSFTKWLDDNGKLNFTQRNIIKLNLSAEKKLTLGESGSAYSIPLANYYNSLKSSYCGGPFAALAEKCGITSSNASAAAEELMNWEKETGWEIFPFEIHVFFTGTRKNFDYPFVFGIQIREGEGEDKFD